MDIFPVSVLAVAVAEGEIAMGDCTNVAYESAQRSWTSKRLANDGLRNLAIFSDAVWVEAYSASEREWFPKMLDKADGRTLRKSEWPSSAEGERVGLNHAIRKWRTLVQEVEMGYEFGIEDYTNDLSSRTLVEEALAASPYDTTRARGVVADLDRRFMEATRDWPEMRALVSDVDKWLRVPKKLVGNLAGDTAHM